MIWGKVLCTWCETEATTTAVQMPACATHEREYKQRRRSGESFVTIQQDFWRRRWADERKQQDAQVSIMRGW